MRRALHLTAVASLLTAGGVALVAPAARGDAPVACDTGTLISPMDIDADGRSDLVVGVPEAGGGKGAVDVHYGANPITGQSLRDQRFTAAYFGLPAAKGSGFGASVSFAEVDGNACRELAIGEPGADGGRGAVVIAFGSPSGVSATGAIVLHGTSAGEHFGAVVRSALNDLWVSAPDRAVSGHPGAGAVDHFRISRGSVSLVQHVTESTPNVPGIAESYDHFGRVLDVGVPSSETVPGPDPSVPGRLYVGVPYEDVGSAKDAGDVVVLDQSAATGLVTQGVAVSQDSPGVSGHAEAGDHFGAALASVESSGGQGSRFFVGVPGEAVGATRRAGIVQAFDLSAAHHVTQASTISQESPGVPGSSETDDRFGSALAISSGCQDLPVIALAIGAPGESIGSARGAGAVTFVTPVVTSADEDFCPITVRQGVSKIGGKPETGDRFGAALGELANPYGKPDGMGHLAGGGAFLIGVPGEDLGGKADAGAVQVDRNTGNVPSGSFYDSAGTAAGEQYGTVPAWSLPNFSCYC